jgi:hypothetical protein
VVDISMQGTHDTPPHDGRRMGRPFPRGCAKATTIILLQLTAGGTSVNCPSGGGREQNT